MAFELPPFLLVPLKDIQDTRYSELASSAIIVYEHLITIDQEICLVWQAPWSIAKILFLLNRYHTLFVVVFNNFALFSLSITDDVRLNWFRWQGWTGLAVCALAEIILQLRLYALYYGNKKVLALMVCSFLAAMAASATIMGTVLSEVTAKAHFLPAVTFCVPFNPSQHFYAFWIPILSFETLLCSLALIRGYKSYKNQELRLRIRRREPHKRRGGENLGNAANLRLEAGNNDGLNILEVLLRDSVGYFIVMFATYFTTTMTWIFGPPTVIEIPIGFTVAMSCVIGNRLLLNLRSSHKRTPSANVYTPHGTFSRDPISQVATGRSHLTSAGGTTIEDEHGEERSAIGVYELQALRTLKHHRSV